EEAPYRIETGTLNHAALAGVKAAIEYIAGWGEGESLRDRVVSAMSGIAAYEHEVGRYYHDRVREIPGVRVWGPDFSDSAPGRRAPTISITVQGVPAEAVARHLGEQGIQVWDGNFYAVRAIETLGLSQSGGVLRTGIVLYNTREEVDRLLAGISEVASSRR
ncbi:MAG TPA: aminotransferase class V-fold PLP-dependent enzyme, partial [Thermoanaerobaculia bacterium]|nr:aminotransferase class V-fold PLP-dependent enzyme [Thermoanaerobaculia bacterium]